MGIGEGELNRLGHGKLKLTLLWVAVGTLSAERPKILGVLELFIGFHT